MKKFFTILFVGVLTVSCSSFGKDKIDLAEFKTVDGLDYGVGFGNKNIHYVYNNPLFSNGIEFAKQRAALCSSDAKQIALTAWKNDRINGQIVAFTGKEKKLISAKATALTNEKGQIIPASAITISHLKYIRASKFAKYSPYTKVDNKIVYDPNGCVMNADNLYQNARKAWSEEPFMFRPMWFTVDVPANAACGIYSGLIKVTMGNKIFDLPISVEVLNLSVPNYSDRVFDLQFWIHPQAMAHYYSGCFPDASYALLNGSDTKDDSIHKCKKELGGIELWSNEHLRLYKPVLEELFKAGQRTTVVNITRDPWPNGWARTPGDLGDHQTYYAYDDLIKWSREKSSNADNVNGYKYSLDFSNFDKFVSFAFSCGLNKYLDLFGILPWTASGDGRGQLIVYDKNEKKDVRVKLNAAEWKVFWEKYIPVIIAHLNSKTENVQKGKTWYDVARVAVDERNINTFAEVNAILEKAKPTGKNRMATSASGTRHAIAVDYTINYQAYCSGGEDHMRGMSDSEFVKHVKERSRRGLSSAIYTATESYPGHFTTSQPAENSFIGWYAAKLGAPGYLRWAVDSWNNGKTLETFTADFSNESTDNKIFVTGDTFSIYPGDKNAAVPFIRSSVRHELQKEGFLYFEKLEVLKKLGATAEVEKLLNKIVRPKRKSVSYSYEMQFTNYFSPAAQKSKDQVRLVTERAESEFIEISRRWQK